MTWTHNGQPIGQPQKPWRLTRAQRVEMEAALARLRGDVRTVPDVDGWYSSETVEVARVLGVYTMEAVNDGMPESVARARLAIAIRAAMRADEDARCEEAGARCSDDETETLREMCEWPAMRRRWTYARLRDEEIAALPLSMCAWTAVSRDGNRLKPGVYSVQIDEPIPLALWEIDERRRRETVRAVVALLTWGLS